MLNQVNLIGRVGKEPESSYTQGGTCITKLSLATTEKWKDKNTGEMKELTEWHRCVFFGRIAEFAAEYVKKGSLVYVSGKLHHGEYTDRDGVKRYTTDVNCDTLKLLQSKKDSEGGGEKPQKPQPSGQQQSAPADNFDEDSIPF